MRICISLVFLMILSFGGDPPAAAANCFKTEPNVIPVPMMEAREVIEEWLLHKGYTIQHKTKNYQQVVLTAEKAGGRWVIDLRPHSALAARIHAQFIEDGAGRKARSEPLDDMWGMLCDYLDSTVGDLPEPASSIPDAVMSRSAAVVCISAENGNRPLRVSGVIIDTRGLILCTAHGLDGHGPVTVEFRNGGPLIGRVVKIDKNADLTLVDVQSALKTAVSLSGGRDILAAGERLFSVGCLENNGRGIYAGTVSGPPRKKGDQPLWQVAMHIMPGSSGSPVFDNSGNLAGIIKGRFRGSRGTGFVIPFQTIAEFIRSAARP